MPRKPGHLETDDLRSLLGLAREDPELNTSLADDDPRGLYARVRRGGVEWFLRYRRPQGGRGWKKLGSWPDLSLKAARLVARKWIARQAVAASEGKDLAEVAQEQKLAGRTVREAAAAYLDDLKTRAETGSKRGRKSTWYRYDNQLRLHVLPKIGDRRLRSITVEDVRKLHRSVKAAIKSDGSVGANRILTILSAVFELARERDPKLTNPVKGVQKFEETGKRRGLTRDELQRLGETMHRAERDGYLIVNGHKRRPNPSAILAVRFLALTGWRRSELVGQQLRVARRDLDGLRWSDVDLEKGIATVATKTGTQDRVLGAAAVKLLKSAKPEDAVGTDPVIPGARPGEPFVRLDKSRITLYEDAGIQGVDLHSLRHSFASIGSHVQSGKFAALVGPLIGHGYTARQSITARYVHEDLELLRPAADAIAAEISGLLGLREPAEVVDISARRARPTTRRA